MTKNLKSDIFAFYAYQFFSNLDFARGIFVIYLLSRGLSAAQVGIIQSILFITSLIAEVPTGYLADKYGRKLLILCGLVLCACFPVAMIFANQFEIFVVLFFLLGIGYSMERGADSALLYSRLETEGREAIDQYKKINGRARATRYTALSIATFLGGFFQSYGWSYVFIAVGLTMVISAFAIAFFKEPPRRHLVDHKGVDATSPALNDNFGILTGLKRLVVDSRSHGLIYLLLAFSFLSAMSTPLFIFAQILFKSYGLDAASIGHLISAGLIANSLTSAFAHKIPFGNGRVATGAIGFVMCAALAALFFYPPLTFVIAIFVVTQALPPILMIHFSEICVSKLSSQLRATGLSILSLCAAIQLSIGNVLIGFLIDRVSVQFALGVLCVFPLLTFVCFLRFSRQRGASK